jgi:F420-non-reducing hydrogenase small subunit
VVAVGTCAISGGVASLGDRDDVRDLFIDQASRRHVPRLLPRCHPIDAFVDVDRYLPGCPPTPRLFMALLDESGAFDPPRIVCRECGRKKVRDKRPQELLGFQQGQVLPDICLVNQGYLCIGTSTRGGCGAPCPQAGHPCVGCRGPSDALIEKDSSAWFASIKRVFGSMTDIPEPEIDVALRSPQLSLFLFQFSDYAVQERSAAGLSERDRPPKSKEKML